MGSTIERTQACVEEIQRLARDQQCSILNVIDVAANCAEAVEKVRRYGASLDAFGYPTSNLDAGQAMADLFKGFYGSGLAHPCPPLVARPRTSPVQQPRTVETPVKVNIAAKLYLGLGAVGLGALIVVAPEFGIPLTLAAGATSL